MRQHEIERTPRDEASVPRAVVGAVSDTASSSVAAKGRLQEQHSSTESSMEVEWHGLEPVYKKTGSTVALERGRSPHQAPPSDTGQPVTTTSGYVARGGARSQDPNPRMPAGAGSTSRGGRSCSAPPTQEIGDFVSPRSRPASSSVAERAGRCSRPLPPDDETDSDDDSFASAPANNKTEQFAKGGAHCDEPGSSSEEDPARRANNRVNTTFAPPPRELLTEVVPQKGGRHTLPVFRFQAYFDAKVQRLEFEVEWQSTPPSVGRVQPSGAADIRGISHGDRIAEVNGVVTAGQGRDDLLPLLKMRPLMLSVDRIVDLGAAFPHVELDIEIDGGSGSEHGLDLAWSGQVPVIKAVAKGSPAWVSGMLPGDAIFSVDGHSVVGLAASALRSALHGRPLSLTVRRRPLNMSAEENAWPQGADGGAWTSDSGENATDADSDA